MSKRLNNKLAALKVENRAGFIPFIMAGDPSPAATLDILKELPSHGADIIELGVPFSDPMADGPTIQSAAIRALEAGTKLNDIFDMVRSFRQEDDTTPIILMGYFNPVFHRGVEQFMQDASAAGVDGLIIVDLPAEELSEALPAASKHGIDIIRLIAPTSLEDRLDTLCHDASGFVYYIAVKGITGDKSADYGALTGEVVAIRNHTDLPVAIGFGIKSADDVRTVAQISDLVVVGSAIVKEMEQADNTLKERVLSRCAALTDGTLRK